MAKSSKDTKSVSDELFHAAAQLAASLAYIADHGCGVDPVDILVLWHIRFYGKLNESNCSVIMRNDLTKLLGDKFRYSDADVTKLLDGLQNKGLIDRPHLTDYQRKALFEAQSGRKLAVLLLPAGSNKIEEFKGLVKTHFDDWLSQQSMRTRFATRKFAPVAAGFAKWLLKHMPNDQNTPTKKQQP